MNLRGIANPATSTINQNEPVSVQVSTGYTIDPATLKQVPSYNIITGFGNVQALDSSDLKQIDGLNLQGDIRAIYVYGALAGVIRPKQTGGDIIQRQDGSQWLVVKVLETWPNWSKAVIVLQEP